MKLIFILILTSFIFQDDNLEGTYSYCCFSCYDLTLGKDNNFVLKETAGEWDTQRISKGKYIVTGDTIKIKELSRQFLSITTIDTTSDVLTSYEFIILKNGQLKSESFNCVLNPRYKEYSYFIKE